MQKCKDHLEQMEQTEFLGIVITAEQVKLIVLSGDVSRDVDYLPSSRMPAPLPAPAPTYQPKKEPAPAPAPLPIQTNSYEAQTSTALPSPMPSHPQQPESTGDQYPRYIGSIFLEE